MSSFSCIEKRGFLYMTDETCKENALFFTHQE